MKGDLRTPIDRSRSTTLTLVSTRVIALALVVTGMAAICNAQDYPAKPVRIVSPFVPGGFGDLLPRAIAAGLTEPLGQQVIVENRPGGSTIIGMQVAAKSPPDGYTLVFATVTSLATNVSAFRNLPYDPVRDFAPIALCYTTPLYLAVHPSLPVRSVKQLIALAKAHPGQLNYASGGVGSAQHVPMEMLKSMTGINIVHVPYKGLTPAFNDVVAGEVPIIMPGLVSVLPYHQAGRLRIIATTGATRTSVTPDIPTIAQAGVPGYEFDSWTGFLAPTGTPAAIVSQVHAEIARISGLPDIRERLTTLGFDVVGGTSEAFSAVIKDNNARLGKVIREAGIKGE